MHPTDANTWAMSDAPTVPDHRKSHVRSIERGDCRNLCATLVSASVQGAVGICASGFLPPLARFGRQCPRRGGCRERGRRPVPSTTGLHRRRPTLGPLAIWHLLPPGLVVRPIPVLPSVRQSDSAANASWRPATPGPPRYREFPTVAYRGRRCPRSLA